MSDRATLEAIRDEHVAIDTVTTMDAAVDLCACGLRWPCPARTAAEIGLALADREHRFVQAVRAFAACQSDPEASTRDRALAWDDVETWLAAHDAP
jgi:hypothetical protein